MINGNSRRWELAHPFIVICTVYFLHIVLSAIIFWALYVFFPQSSAGGAGLVFSFTGFLSRLFMLFSFVSAVLMGERIFKEKLLANKISYFPGKNEHGEALRGKGPALKRRQKRRKSDILCGLGLGAALFTLLFFVFEVMGWLTVTGFLCSKTAEAPPGVYSQLLWSVPVLLVSAGFEELLARGFFLSVCKKTYGATGGILFSAVFFSLMHLNNPHFSAAGLIGILLAGVWFGLAYVLTGALYLSTAMHFSWNISQMLLGFPVSGLVTPHLVRTEISGPVVWTGGAFGPEAGLSGYFLILLGMVVVFFYAKKRMPTKDLPQQA